MDLWSHGKRHPGPGRECRRLCLCCEKRNHGLPSPHVRRLEPMTRERLLFLELGPGRKGAWLTGVELPGHLGRKGRMEQPQRHQVGCQCQMLLGVEQGRSRGNEGRGRSEVKAEPSVFVKHKTDSCHWRDKTYMCISMGANDSKVCGM